MKGKYELRGKNPIADFCLSARKKKFIDILKLCHVLAFEKKYNQDIMITLWQGLDLNIRLGTEPDTSTPEKKIGAWFHLLERMTTRRVAGFSLPEANEKNSPIDLLLIENGKIQLKDLKIFFEVQLKLPPPSLLFPSTSDSIIDITKEQKTSTSFQEGKDNTNQLQKKVIKKEDKGWRIYFDGKNARLDNPMAVKYISVALNNPRKEFTYSQIIENIQGINQTHVVDKNYDNMAKQKGDKQSRLEKEEGQFAKNKDDMNSTTKHPKEETVKFFRKVQDKYLYANDQEEIAQLIDYFKSEYKYEVYKKDDTIKMGKKIKPNKAENNRKTIERAHRAIMKKTERNLPSLYKHFKLYLEIGKGLICYNLPEDDPFWEIIE